MLKLLDIQAFLCYNMYNRNAILGVISLKEDYSISSLFFKMLMIDLYSKNLKNVYEEGYDDGYEDAKKDIKEGFTDLDDS